MNRSVLLFSNIASDKPLVLAELTLRKNEVPVGCVLVYDNRLSFEGGNTVNENKSAIKHAELVAFDKAAVTARTMKISEENFFSKCKLYVTVEPCIMCAGAINILKLKKVFYGCINSRFGGCEGVMQTLRVPFESNFPYSENLTKTSSEREVELLKNFYACENPNAPEEKRKAKSVKRRDKLKEENIFLF